MKVIRSAWVAVALSAAGATAAFAQDPSDAIFNDNVVATYQLTMNQADWNTIVNDPTGQGRLWKPCTMTWQGSETFTNVAVRAGGHPGPGANPKPHIRLKFDEFVPNQKWRGMDAIKLESMTKNLDRSMLRERLAFWVHRSLGPAARVVHARLYVNGDFKGLYSAIEPIRKAYARYHWKIPNPDGNLYEIDIYDPNDNLYNGGPPFDHYLWRDANPASYVPYWWKPVTNEVGGNYQDVVNLLNVLNNVSSSTRRTQLEGLINLDSFLAYLAGLIATSNFDALPEWASMPNNHFWYHREDTNRMEIIPWDLDVTFMDIVETRTGTYLPQMSIWYQFQTTKATAWIQGDSVASAAYKAKIRNIVDGPFVTLQSRLDFIYNQIRSHAYADPYKPFTNAQFDAEVSGIRNSFIPKRIASLNAQVPPPPPPTGTNNAQFLSHTIPTTMTAGQVATVTIAMRNTGTTTWAGGYGLGHSAGVTPYTWRERRVWLAAGETVAPNATKTFSFTITAPSTAGTYAFPAWRMVQDGVGYFGTSSPALNITVTSGGGGGPITKSFQDGVAPTSAYAGTRDAYIVQDSPTTNFGTAAFVAADGDTNGAGNDARALLRWYVTDIPVGSTVQSARIILNVTNPSAQTYELYRIYRYWSETQVTWIQAQSGFAWAAPGADGSGDRGQTVRGAVTASATGQVTITLNSAGISMVQAWVNDPANNFGLILLDSANADGLAFASSESATAGQRPRLEVTYTASAVADSYEEVAPADSVIDGGENPLMLEDAIGDTAASGEAGGEGDGGSACGALGWEALLILAVGAMRRHRSRSQSHGG